MKPTDQTFTLDATLTSFELSQEISRITRYLKQQKLRRKTITVTVTTETQP